MLQLKVYRIPNQVDNFGHVQSTSCFARCNDNKIIIIIIIKIKIIKIEKRLLKMRNWQFKLKKRASNINST